MNASVRCIDQSLNLITFTFTFAGQRPLSQDGPSSIHPSFPLFRFFVDNNNITLKTSFSFNVIC